LDFSTVSFSLCLIQDFSVWVDWRATEGKAPYQHGWADKHLHN
jgi:hypothetical protein